MVKLHIKLKRIMNAATWLPTDLPTPILGMGSVCETFSEHGHVAYQIKENHECSNMVANIWPTEPPSPHNPRDGVNTFSEHGHVAYDIKLNGIMNCSNIVANILPVEPPPPPPPPPPHTHTHTHTPTHTNAPDSVSRSKVNFFRTWSCYISN